ncbi:hypothetical protein Tco_1547486 [Tanacetum coccineum]
MRDVGVWGGWWDMTHRVVVQFGRGEESGVEWGEARLGGVGGTQLKDVWEWSGVWGEQGKQMSFADAS